MNVRGKGDITQWFKFFLVGIIETSKKGIETFDNILKLKTESENSIMSLGSRSNNAQVILNYLFKRPLIDAQKAKELTNLSLTSVYKLLTDLEKLEIIKEVTGMKRGKFYLSRDYINLIKTLHNNK
ncbi:MAG: hypothetical protein ACPGEG_09870 [Salibacteraceae bacterium]